MGYLRFLNSDGKQVLPKEAILVRPGDEPHKEGYSHLYDTKVRFGHVDRTVFDSETGDILEKGDQDPYFIDYQVWIPKHLSKLDLAILHHNDVMVLDS